MSFNEEGKETFSMEITFDELSQYRFCPGKVFYKKLSGRPVLIFNPGNLITEKEIEKYRSVSEKVKIEKVASPSNIFKVKKYMTAIKEANGEEERLRARKEFLFLFKQRFLQSTIDNNSPFDLMVGIDEVFFGMRDDLSTFLASKSDEIYERAALLGSLMVSFALVFGYCDFKFLQDIYHLSFMLEISLLEAGGILFNDALENYRTKGLSALEANENFVVPAHKEIFKNHCENAVERIQKMKVLNDPTVAWVADRHHERINGSGFPKKLNEDTMSDLEMCLVFLSGVLPSGRPKFESMEMNYVANLFEKNENNNPESFCSIRLKEMIFHIINQIEDPELDEINAA